MILLWLFQLMWFGCCSLVLPVHPPLIVVRAHAQHHVTHVVVAPVAPLHAETSIEPKRPCHPRPVLAVYPHAHWARAFHPHGLATANIPTRSRMPTATLLVPATPALQLHAATCEASVQVRGPGLTTSARRRALESDLPPGFGTMARSPAVDWWRGGG
jgi:hypothetical protein